MHIQARNLRKTYGAKVAVDGISLDLLPGTVTAVLGPNGAGKSTTIKMLSGQISPNEGTILIDGQEYNSVPSQYRGKIGVMPQEVIVWEDLNIKENLEFTAVAQNMSKIASKERVDYLIEALNMQKELKTLARNLSGGFKRRLNLAISIIHDPEVIFLDEPTPGIDPQNRKFLWDFIEQLRSSGKYSIVLTDHYLDEAEKVSDTIYIVDGGKIVASGTLPQLRAQYGKTMTVEVRLAQELDESAQHQLSGAFPTALWLNAQTLSIPTDTGPDTIEQVLALCSRSNYKTETLALKEPSLEDLFLQLTGHQVRD